MFKKLNDLEVRLVSKYPLTSAAIGAALLAVAAGVVGLILIMAGG